MMLSGFRSGLDLGEAEGGLTGVGGSLFDWFVSTGEGWELDLECRKVFPCFGPWLP